MNDQAGAEVRAAYQQGWDAARRDCWAPVQTRWRDVQVGAVLVDRTGKAWMIENIDRKHRIRLYGRNSPTAVDPDEYVMVLTPMPIADAAQALKDGGVSITPLSGEEDDG